MYTTIKLRSLWCIDTLELDRQPGSIEARVHNRQDLSAPTWKDCCDRLEILEPLYEISQGLAEYLTLNASRLVELADRDVVRFHGRNQFYLGLRRCCVATGLAGTLFVDLFQNALLPDQAPGGI
jgi:hypothetical protein